MGLFSPRPEEPTEWAGLPSEPLEARSQADRLPMEGTVDVIELLTGSSTSSITLEIAPEHPAPDTRNDGAGA